MNALTVRDLSVVAGEPRVKDLVIGQRLGLTQARSVRVMIERNRRELVRYGEVLHQVDAKPQKGTSGGRPRAAFFLNEMQALLLCMFASTDRAADVREQLIRVFMAYRAGELRAAPQSKAKRRLPPVYTTADPEHPDFRDPILLLAKRRDELVKFQTFERTRADDSMLAQIPHLLASMRHRKIVRFPRWFHDKDVLAAVVRTHRQAELNRVVDLLKANFGYRAPSRSSLARFWLRLDGLFGTGRKLH